MKLNYDPVLPWSKELSGKPCEPVIGFGDETHKLFDRMKMSMFYLEGQGLAAPQIGIFLKAAVVYYATHIFPIFNPEILESSGSEMAYEACLSLPGASAHYGLLRNQGRVERTTKLLLRYQDENGEVIHREFSDHAARVIQHEVDHLSGIFFIDRTGKTYREMVIRNYLNWREGCQKGVYEDAGTCRV